MERSGADCIKQHDKNDKRKKKMERDGLKEKTNEKRKTKKLKK